MNLKAIVSIPKLPQTYWYLAALRIVLVLIPQLGYIHPDEYFQSIEVFVGKVFQVEYDPPWEFNVTFPIRSMVMPYFTVGLSYRLFSTFNIFMLGFFGKSLISPYNLLVIPRLLMCLLSFCVDFSIYKISSNNNEKYKSKLIVLASSYIMIIYATRTFSNTIELILFALLLYYVGESLVFSNILLKQKEYLNYRYKMSKTTVEKVKFHKLRMYLTTDSLRNCIQISVIVVLGFFNRPTFLAFALFPVFFWLYRGLGSKVIMTMHFHLRMAILVLCSIPTILFCIVVDSLFYGYLTWGEIGLFDVTIDNFVFTPLNFVRYNIDTKNLENHGLHPRFLHILVNIPLLFNVMAISGALGLWTHTQNFFKGKHHLLPSIRSIKGLMTLSLIAPVALLSIFPHQEPRFLIPTVIPLVYLYANSILPESDSGLVKTQEMAVTHRTIKIKKPSRLLLKLWAVFNLIFVLFYGFLHQGGVYNVTKYLSNDMRINPTVTDFHIVTSHIYSIPESFFLQKSTEKLYFAKDKKYAVNKRAFLYQDGSKNLDFVIGEIGEIIARNEHLKKFKPKKKSKVFLVIPTSLSDKLNYYEGGTNFTFTELKTFYPHLSTEAFPDVLSDFLFLCNNFDVENVMKVLPFTFYKLLTSFGLKIYQIGLAIRE